MKIDLNNYSVKTKSQKVNGKFINRELSWLSFNERVLYCANNPAIPLNERLKFLGITSSNLDEFISVRYADCIKYPNIEPIGKILKGIKKCLTNEQNTYKILKNELKKCDVHISKISDLSKKEKTVTKDIFNKYIFPLITPVNIGTTNDIPNFYSGQICLAVTVEKDGNNDDLIFIPLEKNIDTIYEIGNKVLMVENIILEYLNELFINKKINSKGYFKIVKDNSITLDHDQSKFLLDRMIKTIEKREYSNPLFLIVDNEMPKELIDVLKTALDVRGSNIYNESFMVDYTRFLNHRLLSNKYSYKPFNPFTYEITDGEHSIFSILKKKDILLHHPYDSYDTVVKFISHASLDPDVIGIRQTLYRVSSDDSPIINALCDAARRGKTVTVLIEIKARFDEIRNISLINKLKSAGATVLLGMEYLKTHCKMCLVVRKEGDNIAIYTHIGTGNYNEKTAKQYTDISYLTSKNKIGIDMISVFNILSGVSVPDEKLQKVFYAPINLRKKIIKNIDREIQFAKKGKKAEIFLKLNSINDTEIINKLYEAADNGVKVYIISRGICSIVPKKNIYIKSIVGRFLEHSRIYYFRNNNKFEYYISSADMLTRNLDKRVEVLILIDDKESMRKLKNIINIFKKDTTNSFTMLNNGKYLKNKGCINCHELFMGSDEFKPKIKLPRHKRK